MTANQIKTALRETPFKPFELMLDNGSMVPVTHPDCVLLGRTHCVVLQPDEIFRFLDLDHISGFSRNASNGKPKGKRRRNK